jgi:hypothetical protein
MLTDLIPAKYRRYVYAIAALLAFAYGVWQAVDGDWRQFAISLIGSAVTALAHANTAADSARGDE